MVTSNEFFKNLDSISVCIASGISIISEQDIAVNPEYSGLAKGILGVFWQIICRTVELIPSAPIINLAWKDFVVNFHQWFDFLSNERRDWLQY